MDATPFALDSALSYLSPSLWQQLRTSGLPPSALFLPQQSPQPTVNVDPRDAFASALRFCLQQDAALAKAPTPSSGTSAAATATAAAPAAVVAVGTAPPGASLPPAASLPPTLMSLLRSIRVGGGGTSSPRRALALALSPGPPPPQKATGVAFASFCSRLLSAFGRQHLLLRLSQASAVSSGARAIRASLLRAQSQPVDDSEPPKDAPRVGSAAGALPGGGGAAASAAVAESAPTSSSVDAALPRPSPPTLSPTSSLPAPVVAAAGNPALCRFNVTDYDWLGFDLDHTLITFKTDAFNAVMTRASILGLLDSAAYIADACVSANKAAAATATAAATASPPGVAAAAVTAIAARSLAVEIVASASAAAAAPPSSPEAAAATAEVVTSPPPPPPPPPPPSIVEGVVAPSTPAAAGADSGVEGSASTGDRAPSSTTAASSRCPSCSADCVDSCCCCACGGGICFCPTCSRTPTQPSSTDFRSALLSAASPAAFSSRDCSLLVAHLMTAIELDRSGENDDAEENIGGSYSTSFTGRGAKSGGAADARPPPFFIAVADNSPPFSSRVGSRCEAAPALLSPDLAWLSSSPTNDTPRCDAIVASLAFRPDIGLLYSVLDTLRGNVLSIDSAGCVASAYHGTRLLSRSEREAAYGSGLLEEYSFYGSTSGAAGATRPGAAVQEAPFTPSPAPRRARGSTAEHQLTPSALSSRFVTAHSGFEVVLVSLSALIVQRYDAWLRLRKGHLSRLEARRVACAHCRERRRQKGGGEADGSGSSPPRELSAEDAEDDAIAFANYPAIIDAVREACRLSFGAHSLYGLAAQRKDIGTIIDRQDKFKAFLVALRKLPLPVNQANVAVIRQQPPPFSLPPPSSRSVSSAASSGPAPQSAAAAAASSPVGSSSKVTRRVRTFLLSNSSYDHVSLLMSYAYGADWADLFDAIFVDARKQVFFSVGTGPGSGGPPKPAAEGDTLSSPRTNVGGAATSAAAAEVAPPPSFDGAPFRRVDVRSGRIMDAEPPDGLLNFRPSNRHAAVMRASRGSAGTSPAAAPSSDGRAPAGEGVAAAATAAALPSSIPAFLSLGGPVAAAAAVEHPSAGNVYSGGNITTLMSTLAAYSFFAPSPASSSQDSASGPLAPQQTPAEASAAAAARVSVCYVGDHIATDVAMPTAVGWHAIAIVPALEALAATCRGAPAAVAMGSASLSGLVGGSFSSVAGSSSRKALFSRGNSIMEVNEADALGADDGRDAAAAAGATTGAASPSSTISSSSSPRGADATGVGAGFRTSSSKKVQPTISLRTLLQPFSRTPLPDQLQELTSSPPADSFISDDQVAADAGDYAASGRSTFSSSSSEGAGTASPPPALPKARGSSLAAAVVMSSAVLAIPNVEFLATLLLGRIVDALKAAEKAGITKLPLAAFAASRYFPPSPPVASTSVSTAKHAPPNAAAAAAGGGGGLMNWISSVFSRSSESPTVEDDALAVGLKRNALAGRVSSDAIAVAFRLESAESVVRSAYRESRIAEALASTSMALTASATSTAADASAARPISLSARIAGAKTITGGGLLSPASSTVAATASTPSALSPRTPFASSGFRATSAGGGGSWSSSFSPATPVGSSSAPKDAAPASAATPVSAAIAVASSQTLPATTATSVSRVPSSSLASPPEPRGRANSSSSPFQSFWSAISGGSRESAPALATKGGSGDPLVVDRALLLQHILTCSLATASLLPREGLEAFAPANSAPTTAPSQETSAISSPSPSASLPSLQHHYPVMRENSSGAGSGLGCLQWLHRGFSRTTAPPPAPPQPSASVSGSDDLANVPLGGCIYRQTVTLAELEASAKWFQLLLVDQGATGGASAAPTTAAVAAASEATAMTAPLPPSPTAELPSSSLHQASPDDFKFVLVCCGLKDRREEDQESSGGASAAAGASGRGARRSLDLRTAVFGGASPAAAAMGDAVMPHELWRLLGASMETK